MLDHPYDDLSGGQWLRGNLHAHTTRSDGAREPQAVVDDYAGRGYGFLMLSDHDIYTGPEDHAALNSRGLLLIPGNEITKGGSHLLHVGADRRVEPHADRQRVMDAVNGRQGFVIVNHPNWQENFGHCPIERLREWDGYCGVEIYNGVIGRLEGSPYALERWEALLSEGRRVWGFANDDSHRAEDVGLGWNMAYVREPTPAGVIEALHAGRFYASTGVEIRDIRVDGKTIRIETNDAERVVAHTRWGHRLAVADGPGLEIEVPNDVPYVRFTCWGRGERFAWTQPFWVEGD